MFHIGGENGLLSPYMVLCDSYLMSFGVDLGSRLISYQVISSLL